MNRRVDLGLAVLLLLLIAFNVPYLASTLVPVHDTFVLFQDFHYFYSEFFYHHQIAHWIPYGTFGLQADYHQLITLTPINYLFGLMGGLLRMRDVLLLFKLSLIGEQAVFLFGMFMLSRRLFSRSSTVFLVSLAAIGSTVWYAQLWFDFRIYYMLPLVLFLIATFLDTRRPEVLSLAGITGVAWAVGNVPYFLPLWVFVLIVICSIPFLKDRSLWRAIFSRSRSNLLAFAAFAFIAGAYLVFTARSLDFTTLHAPGRDPETGKVSLQTFLTYGGRANLLVVLQGFVLGWPLHLPWGSGADNSVYVGLLPFALFVWALVKERRRLFLGIVGGIFVLVWLSIGGVFTSALYYLPLMSNYRHVGLVYGLVKTLIIIAAGFGMDALWSTRNGKRLNVILSLVACAVLVEAVGSLPHFLNETVPGPDGVNWGVTRFVAFFSRVALYVVAVGLTAASVGSLRNRLRARHAVSLSTDSLNPLKTALILGLFLDIASFQLLLYHIQVPKLPPGYEPFLDSVQVSELQYQEERRSQPIDYREDTEDWEPVDVRRQHALGLTTQPGAMAIYVDTYSFAQFDPCATQYRADFWSSGVDRLLQSRKGDNPALQRVLGCDAPKLRLVPDAIVVESVEAGEEAVRTLTDLDRVVVIGPGGGVAEAGVARNGAAAVDGDLAVTQFSANGITVEADLTNGGAWLVYADAFHPGWQATVNGKDTPVAQAYLAFKAVWLSEGHSVVRFAFRHGLNSLFSNIIAWFGVVFSLCLFAALIRVLFRPR